MRAPISRAAVIKEAMAMIDEGGLDGLTMRRLAERLGVYPTSVYWHAGNKAQLLAIVCEAAMNEVTLPEREGCSWQHWIVDLGREIRQSLGKHPDLIVYFTGQIQVSTSSLALAEGTLSVLESAGFSGRQLVHAYNTTMAAIFGWLNSEYASTPKDAAGEWQDFFRTELAASDRDGLPTLHGNLALLEDRAFMLRWNSGRTNPMNESFEFMLATLVGGLDALLLVQDGNRP